MKKFTLYIVAALAIFGIAYTIGYYIGQGLVQERQLAQIIKAQQPVSTNEQEQQQTIEALEQSLRQEQARTEQLQQALEQQNKELVKLQNAGNMPTDSAPEPAKVIPSTAYERTAFVTNLIHQFNADNASTEIIDLDCEHDFCFLTANVSAGAKTNPEIANLMRFLDDKKLSRHYQRVNLLKVKKSDNETSEIKISLNMK